MSDSPIGKAKKAVIDKVAERREWWELPVPAALAMLSSFRDDLREFNLYDTEVAENGDAKVTGEPPPYRTYDGSQTDPDDPDMGKTGMRFGRNVPLQATYPHEQEFLDPSPRDVSNQLLNRDSFKPATSLNVLAACWLQFQNHDWFSHGDNSETEYLEIPIDEGDDWPEH